MGRQRKKPDPATIYVAVESFTIGGGEAIGASVTAGDRLRGDNPAVAATWPAMWAEDGAGDDELAQRRAALRTAETERAEPTYAEHPRPPRRVRDEDAVVARREARGVNADGRPLVIPPGTRVAGTHPVAKQDQDAFVAVVPAGLKRENALVAREPMTMYEADGRTIRDRVHAGQWVPRSHQLVRINPLLFTLPLPPELE